MRLLTWKLLPLALIACTSSCSKTPSNYEVLASRNVQCPAGSTLRYLPWGESGLQAVCVLEHGPTMIAEYGYIKIEGQNEMGKPVGEWRWLDASGKVVRTERHDGIKP